MAIEELRTYLLGLSDSLYLASKFVASAGEKADVEWSTELPSASPHCSAAEGPPWFPQFSRVASVGLRYLVHSQEVNRP
ncbi:hypothetical protein KC19_5G125600 [Ceratodon purpureus]|uniref:Uncharacterized protein n=1 Tax=Ceratodon purpureus TaxID=3225 RepID=A0A8T0I241_CERPU|nr:hypothetical protein KC19_5G125600 [Ceratodon purpureus]